ncbi:MAG: hypothetical protein RSB36_04185 [Hydrogenoanaerobacterium sp.]
MDDMISRLIDMDKKAQATVKAAEEKRDEMKAAIAGEKEKLRQSYLAHADERIGKMKQAAEDDYSDAEKEIEESFRKADAVLSDEFNKSRAALVSEIAARCRQTKISC